MDLCTFLLKKKKRKKGSAVNISFFSGENSGIFGDCALQLCINVGQEVFHLVHFKEKNPVISPLDYLSIFLPLMTLVNESLNDY